MKKPAALLVALAAAAFGFAAEPAKPAPAAKPKANTKADLELCCDPDDPAAADTKTAAKPAPKPDPAKEDAAKPVAKVDKK